MKHYSNIYEMKVNRGKYLMIKKISYQYDAQQLAKTLLGKVIKVRYKNIWLAAQIIETEAYYLKEKGSHASLGYTSKRRALFMPAGTIYMYYARGGDSLNISAMGEGNAVLIKSAYPYLEKTTPQRLSAMQQLNPFPDGSMRPIEKLCKGQTLLCKSLNLKVTDWDQQTFDINRFYLEAVNYQPEKIIQTTRLGIPVGRDEHLPYRFIDYNYAKHCTKNPLTIRNGFQNYKLLKNPG